MATGKFSNSGVDTFDESKQYIGVRLQRGVPLLDRDWNEAEDVRRYFERKLREAYIGSGVPGASDFQIVPAPLGTDFDFVISPGRAMVDGLDVWNPAPVLFSQQTGAPKLPAATVADSFQVYLTPAIQRVTSVDDSALANSQDINLETCIRDKLTWSVAVARAPELGPAGSLLLATIQRPAAATHIDASMIVDDRGPLLNLASAAASAALLTRRAAVAERKLLDLQLEMDAMQKQVARLFWEVHLSSTNSFYLWGDRANISIRVVDGLGSPVVNCFLACSANSGWLSPSSAVTDANGQATLLLHFVETLQEPNISELGVLSSAVSKVQRATLPNPGAVQYTQVLFEPQELSVISKYSPMRSYQNLASEIPAAAIIRRPSPIVATVSVHAKDAERGVVRGSGSIQVTWGEWVRDWTLTKMYEVSQASDVAVRVGDLMRSGVQPAGFDAAGVQTKLSSLFDQVHTDTSSLLKVRLFQNPQVADDALATSGIIAQTIAQHASETIGNKVNDALNQQFVNLAQDATVQPATKTALQVAKVNIVQTSASTAAGLALRSRQVVNLSRLA